MWLDTAALGVIREDVDLLEKYKTLPQSEKAKFMMSLTADERSRLIAQMQIADGGHQKKQPLPPMEAKPFKETTTGQVLFFLAGIAVIGVVCLGSYKCNKADYSTTRNYSQSSKSSDNWSAWNGSNRQLVAAVKAGLKDPNSFEHLATTKERKWDDYIVTMDYTATNSFGGRVRGVVVAKCDRDGNLIEIIQSR